MKTVLYLLLHASGITAVCLLSNFILCEKENNYDTELQRELQFSFKTGQAHFRDCFPALMARIEKQANLYAHPNNLKYAQRARTAITQSDSIFALLDHLQQSPTYRLLAEVQDKLRVYRSALLELADSEGAFNKYNPAFHPDNWLIQSWENDLDLQFMTLVEQTRMRVALIENFVLQHCFEKVGSRTETGYWFLPVISYFDLRPQVGDTIDINLFLGSGSGLDSSTILLNGEKVNMEHYPPSFQLRVDKPGIYPLHLTAEAKHWTADTMFMVEKTYFLKVLK